MEPEEARRRFAELALGPEEAIDLAEGALLIAVEEQAGLDPSVYLEHLANMGREAAARLGGDRDPYHAIAVLNRYLFEELGFHGNEEDYYDPRNSYLDQVLERRTGLPVTLSLVYMEVARHIGLPLVGIGFPAHFLVKYQGHEGDILLDPFHQGRVVTEEECEVLLRNVYGPRARFSREMLAPIGPKAILARILKNLEGIYLRARDYERAYAAVERILLLQPEAPEETRDQGLIAFRLGRLPEARRALWRYLQMRPNARDAEEVRNQLRVIRRLWAMRN